MDSEQPLKEVQPLREPVRVPEHCGRRMRKLSSTSPSTGKILIVHACDTCGHQEREPSQ